MRFRSETVERIYHQLRDTGVPESMTISISRLTSSGLLVFFLSWAWTHSFAGEIQWHTDFDKALRLASSQGKSVVVDVYADWCGPCRMMERKTFKDEKVQEKITDFIPLKVDADRQPDITERYGVTALPTTLVLNAQGGVLMSQPGYLSPHNFIVFLNAAERSAKDLEAQIQRIESQPQDLKGTLALAQKLLELRRAKEALRLFETALTQSHSADTKALASYGMGMVYASSGEFGDAVVQLERVLDQYPDHRLAKSSEGMLPTVMYFWMSQKKEAGDLHGAQIVYRQLKERYPSNEATYAAEEFLGRD